MGGGYGKGLSARLTDRPKRCSLNPEPALFPVSGVMRRNAQGGGDQPGVVNFRGYPQAVLIRYLDVRISTGLPFSGMDLIRPFYFRLN